MHNNRRASAGDPPFFIWSKKVASLTVLCGGRGTLVSLCTFIVFLVFRFRPIILGDENMGILHSALYWLIIGVMLFFLEMALPGFILFFFALGALAVAGAAWLFKISIAWQLGLFIIVSVLSLLLLRNRIQDRFFSKADVGEEEDEDVMLATPGGKGVVCETISPPAMGKVKYGGSFWRATADEPIEEGEIIAIVHQDQLVVHVKKV